VNVPVPEPVPEIIDELECTEGMDCMDSGTGTGTGTFTKGPFRFVEKVTIKYRITKKITGLSFFS
jgi:hypothetical protein